MAPLHLASPSARVNLCCPLSMTTYVLALLQSLTRTQLYRPSALSSLSWMTTVSWYKRVPRSGYSTKRAADTRSSAANATPLPFLANQLAFQPEHPLFATHALERRMCPVVPRVICHGGYPRLPQRKLLSDDNRDADRDKNRHSYALSLLIACTPFRNLTDLAPGVPPAAVNWWQLFLQHELNDTLSADAKNFMQMSDLFYERNFGGEEDSELDDVLRQGLAAMDAEPDHPIDLDDSVEFNLPDCIPPDQRQLIQNVQSQGLFNTSVADNIPHVDRSALFHGLTITEKLKRLRGCVLSSPPLSLLTLFAGPCSSRHPVRIHPSTPPPPLDRLFLRPHTPRLFRFRRCPVCPPTFPPTSVPLGWNASFADPCTPAQRQPRSLLRRSTRSTPRSDWPSIRWPTLGSVRSVRRLRPGVRLTVLRFALTLLRSCHFVANPRRN